MRRRSFVVCCLLLLSAVLWAQSGRRKPPEPQPTPEVKATTGFTPDAPTRGTGTPVWVAFASDKTSAGSEITPKPAQPLAERAAEWLFQYGGFKVGRLPDALTASEAQELARKLSVGYLVLVQLGETRAQPKDARCSDPCNPKCLRDIASYPAHFYLFTAGSGAPQLDSTVAALFDPYLYNPASCPPRSRGRGGRLYPDNAPVCLNAAPTELTPDALECLGRKVGDQINREIKGPNK
jgi:hypothetical protein